MVRGCTTRGWGGDGSTLGPTSSRWVRTNHPVRPPIAPREENRVAIVPFSDG
jgi:hypothetical protein